MNRLEWLDQSADDPDFSDAIQRLPDRYFDAFTPNDIRRHLTALGRIQSNHPLELDVILVTDDWVEITVFGFDYPFILAIITGLLSSFGVDIRRGEIFTFGNQLPIKTHRSRDAILRQLRPKKIVDYFYGCRRNPTDFVSWKESLQHAFLGIGQHLAANPTHAIERVWHHVATNLPRYYLADATPLSPSQVHFDQSLPDVTQLILTTQDTPFFLFSFCTALAHHGLSVQQLSIHTQANQVEDTFYLTTRHGHKIQHANELDALRLSVVLCKQFTYYLNRAPNPLDAITRYEQLIQTILSSPDSHSRLPFLTNPLALQDLARVLGASDYLWEDFIRTHYESLEPLLSGIQPDQGALLDRLNVAMAGSVTYQDQQHRLNAFKDQEMFCIDLYHLCQRITLIELSERLTELAELVVRTACECVMAEWSKGYGEPKTIGDLPVQWGIFGLGKLGGVALGVASDIELLLIYSDQGYTNGANRVANSLFFGEVMKEMNRFIVAKRSGIFSIDMRLRPYGKDGPLASSLDQFCRYFDRDGDAHLVERLALVRLRWVAGDPQFGHRIESLRDEWVYFGGMTDFSALWDLRKRQHDQKVWQQPNAKFSPGALVDLEYTVQGLQVRYGAQTPQLRTPRIREALRGLQSVGLLDRVLVDQLVNGYLFLRRVINGLRVLRGSAEDLNLPASDELEFDHLARRMGYEAREGISAADQLLMEFETVTAMVRGFLEQHFSRDSLASDQVVNVADWVLNPLLPMTLVDRIFAGFRYPEQAARNIRLLSDSGDRVAFARVAVLALQWLKSKPNPDRALNHWERFVRADGDATAHFELLLSQPARLDMLLDVFSMSDYLSDLLIRHPDEMGEVTKSGGLHTKPQRGSLNWDESDHQLDALSFRYRLRRFKHREMLRIAIQDLTLRVELPVIYRHLSLVAETCLMAAWNRAILDVGAMAIDGCFCMLAMGKLGGSELNYSSDIDLIPVLDARGLAVPLSQAIEWATQVVKQVRDDLAMVTGEGHCYRVDFNLRPFGRSGALVVTMDALLQYFKEMASPWEMQAMIKMRPVAGDWSTGFEVMDTVRECVLGVPMGVYRESVAAMRRQSIEQSERVGGGMDIKNGRGGIRDIEFLVQVMILEAQPKPWIRRTLPAIGYLKRVGRLGAADAADLITSYTMFRRLEHALQLLDNQQTHCLPVELAEWGILARHVLAEGATGERLRERIEEATQRCSALFWGVVAG